MDAPQFFQLLSDQTRLRCLVLLGEKKVMCVCEFVEILAIPQPKLSRHLSYLRTSGLILDERKKQWVYYQIHPNLPREFRELLEKAIAMVEETAPFAADLVRAKEETATACPVS